VVGIFRLHRTNDRFSRSERPHRLREVLNIGAGTVENLIRFVIAGFGFLVAGDYSGMQMLDDTNAGLTGKYQMQRQNLLSAWIATAGLILKQEVRPDDPHFGRKQS